jgi:PAS domain S-box-containing protein
VGTPPVNILLVDDQPAKLLTYRTVLDELGETLIQAGSAREALKVLLEHEVAVALIDVQMPDLDGFELAAMIREHPRHRRTALVFVSAVHVTDDDRLRGYRSGAVDYVSVPIVPEMLRAKVAVFVDLYRKTREVETVNLELATLNRELEARVEERTATLASSLAELRASEQRLSLALDSAGAASWDWDAVADRLDWTPRFCALHGFDADDPPTLQTVLARTHEGDRERLEARVSHLLETPGDDEWNEVFRVVHPTRGVREISGLGRAMRDVTGRVVRMTGIDLDVTERVVAERALQEADRRKDEFLAVLAHELRNPMAPILNAVQVLRLGRVDEVRRAKAFEIIERQVLHMVRLVDDLLDVSRITRGKITLQRKVVALDDIIARAVESSGPAIASRGLALGIDGEREPLHIHADPARLVQVLTNILHNAAKFTPRGGRIDLTARRERRHVVLTVKDTGIGIAASSLPRIFDLFTQAPSSGEQLEGGLGIGLALSRRLIEMHGGTLAAKSEGPHRGSEFIVRLPLVRRRASQELASMSASLRPKARRVVIADDNEDVLEMLAWMLMSQGHEVHMACDGLEAVAAAAAYQPDIVMLDLGMPRLDGYEAARRIRAEPWGRGIKLIAQSGYGQDDDKRRAIEAGFDLHLTKPIDLPRLNEALLAFERPAESDDTRDA